MAKEISYKAGSKQQYDSLYKARIMSEEEAQPKSVADELQKHIDWLDTLLEKEGINQSFSVHHLTEENVANTKPLVIAALTALDHLHGASMGYFHLDTNNKKTYPYMAVIKDLVKAIESMLYVQEAVHEMAIIDLKRRVEKRNNHNKKRSIYKQRWIETCEPKYLEIKKTNPRLSDWATAKKIQDWLITEHLTLKSQKTISRWIKDMK